MCNISFLTVVPGTMVLTAAVIGMAMRCLMSEITMEDVARCRYFKADASFSLKAVSFRGPWYILYTTNLPRMAEVDHIYRSYMEKSENLYHVKEIVVKHNGDTYEEDYLNHHLLNGTIIENVSDKTDEVQVFYLKAIAFKGSDYYLFYRCSEYGEGYFDGRFIMSLKPRISEELEKEVLKIEGEQNFLGSLYKLPQKLLKVWQL